MSERRQVVFRPLAGSYPKLPAYVGGLIALLALVPILFGDAEYVVVLLPMYAVLAIATMLITVLWQRDGSLPYFDVGIICVLVTSVYIAYPLFAFSMSGLAWSDLADHRLRGQQATPTQFAQVGWWSVVYLLSLAVSYAVVRRHPAATAGTRLENPPKTQIVAMVFLYLLFFLFTQAIQIIFGVDLNPTYGMGERGVESLPLVLAQVASKVAGMQIVLQFALIVLLVKHADEIVWRWALWLWAAMVALTVILVFGARTSIVFFVLAWLLAHQRLRRPLRPFALLVIGVTVIGATLIFGIARNTASREVFLDSIFSASSEFHGLYGTAFDAPSMRERGQLPDVPWQIYVADILRLIPQQLLPFDKLDQSLWYLDVVGLGGTGVGLMFGVVSEAAVGLGIFEMVLRGVAVGVIFGSIHNCTPELVEVLADCVLYMALRLELLHVQGVDVIHSRTLRAQVYSRLSCGQDYCA